MQIKPNQAFRRFHYPIDTSLDPSKVYTATLATNQPNFIEEGKVFVAPPNGAPIMLLSKADYEVIKD